jgi:hypothetical protein
MYRHAGTLMSRTGGRVIASEVMQLLEEVMQL